MDKLQGAYSLVVMSPRKLIALRDPKGMRPLCMGRIGESVVFASESCALDSIDPDRYSLWEWNEAMRLLSLPELLR